MKPSSPLLAFALLSCSPAPGAPDIQLTDAWARASVPGQTAGAAFLTIRNRGGADDALVEISTVAGSANVHSTSMAGGIMRMRKLERLAIPAGATVKLEPGGMHAMLTDLRQPLLAGDDIELSLRFEKAGQRTLTARVRDHSGDHK